MEPAPPSRAAQIAQAHIGVAGWAIASVNAALFAPSGSHLERYASAFAAVEINS